MKKYLVRTAAVFCLLFFFLVGWLKYRNHQSYQIPIHEGAVTFVNINVDGIYKTMAWDFITNPLFHFQKDKEDEKEKHPGNGINVPANVVLYTLEKQEENVFFGILSLSDSSEAKAFLKKKLDIQDFEVVQHSIQFGKSKNGLFCVAFTQNELAFGVSVSKINKPVKKILTDLLLRKNCSKNKTPLFKKLKQVEGHIAFVQKNANGSLHFKDGKIQLRAVFKESRIRVPEKPTHRKFNKNSSVKAWLNADISGLFSAETIRLPGYIQLKKDSLFAHFTDYIDLEISGCTTQFDTVVAYSFNENFEKIPVKSVKRKKRPHIDIFIQSEPKNLSNFLINENVLNKKWKFNKEVFPLFQLYASNVPNGLQLSSVGNDSISIEKKYSEDFFSLSVDFQQLMKQDFFPFLEQYVVVDSLKVSARKNGDNSMRLKGDLYFKNKTINALVQINSK